MRSLRHNLTIASNTPEVLQGAETLYNWLITPLEGDIESLETLVFVLDGNLRNVPMSVLYDGEKYLIEKNHAIAQVDEELELVITHSDRHHPLLNENFTKNQIENIIQSQNFTTIHWKTHGLHFSRQLVLGRTAIASGHCPGCHQPLNNRFGFPAKVS